MRLVSRCALLFAALAVCALSRGKTLEIHNPFGEIAVQVAPEARLVVRGVGKNREAREVDTQVTRAPGRVIVRCEPSDREPIDLEVRLPLGYALEARTTHGDLIVRGLVRRAALKTSSGDIFLSVPWRATRITLDAEEKPSELITPKGFRFSKNKLDVTEDRTIWRLRDKLGKWDTAFGDIRVRAGRPRKVALSDYPVPPDSPVKFPWQAPALLTRILQGERPPRRDPDAAERSGAPGPRADSEGVVFRSDVRMANFVVSVQNAEGRPVTDLGPENFTVFENGVRQEVSFAGAQDVPFNLAVLLDLSGSTKPDRVWMKAAAKRLVEMARPQDRAAVYALAGGVFHVVSGLTGGKDELREKIEKLPEVSGASPLYDAIVLAYTEELWERPEDRNALIVISDGIDNQISNQESPSSVKFKRLVQGAERMNALLYPIFLRSGERFGRGWSQKGRERLEELCRASGGRLFAAHSIRDLEPVFPVLAEELRSVYSIAYYPQNQDFNGEWRDVRVEVNREGVRVRARPGYYAY